MSDTLGNQAPDLNNELALPRSLEFPRVYQQPRVAKTPRALTPPVVVAGVRNL